MFYCQHPRPKGFSACDCCAALLSPSSIFFIWQQMLRSVTVHRAVAVLHTSGPLYFDLSGPDLELHIVRDVNKAGGNDLLHGDAVSATPLASIEWESTLGAASCKSIVRACLGFFDEKGN